MAESVTYIDDPELLALGIPSAALTAVPVGDRDSARLAASDLASSYLKKRFLLPIISWGSDLQRAVAHLAVFDLMSFRGFDPGSESGAIIVKRSDDAIAWLRDVSRGIVEPIDLIDSSPSIDEQAPLTSSDAGAGWAWPTGGT